MLSDEFGGVPIMVVEEPQDINDDSERCILVNDLKEILKSKDKQTLQKARELARNTLTKIDEFEKGYRIALQQISEEIN